MTRVEDVEVSKGIVTNPHRMGGIPTIKGTRISAEMVVNLMSGDQPMDPMAIITGYPSLTFADLTNAKLWARRQ